MEPTPPPPPPPYDARIEFLESNGTQYIDTKESVDNTTICACTFELVSANISSTYCLGCRWAYQTDNFYVRYNNGSLDVSGYQFAENPIGIISTVIQDMPNQLVKYNGNTRAIRLNLSYSVPYWLFGMKQGSGTSVLFNGICRIYGFSMRKNDALVIDLIPVRIGTTGYMYDKVSGQFFGNDGSGSFILGPDVV